MAKKTKKISRVATTKRVTTSSSSATNMNSTSAPMTESHMTFNQLLAAFILFTVLTIVVLFLANLFFPASIVLGNHMVSMMGALLISSLTLSLIAVGATPLIESGSEAINIKLSNGQWMGIYWVINILAIWGIGRLAEEIGLGLSSWLVAVILGTVINFFQGMIIVFIVSRLADRSA